MRASFTYGMLSGNIYEYKFMAVSQSCYLAAVTVKSCANLASIELLMLYTLEEEEKYYISGILFIH